ncbi:MAG: endonuclease III [Patescibacteria group bacterium]
MIKNSTKAKPDIECILRTLKNLYPTAKTALDYAKPHELLFAVILSAQTTDKQVNKVTKALFQKYKNLEDFAMVDISVFEKDISSIGLYKSKAKSIVNAAKAIVENHKGIVPKSMSELVALPGVGRKTANVVLGELYGIYEGIAVDTHVKRLAQKYGLSIYSDPIKIEKDLMKIIPQKEWREFTLRMIQYGRDYCPANCKNCPNCPLWKCVK